MNSAVVRLLELVPPTYAVQPHSEQEWHKVEQALGTKLPDDYKAYIDHYQGSYVYDFLLVTDPFSEKPHQNLKYFAKQQAEALQYLRSKYGDEACPYSLFPEEGGLLAWGLTDNGDIVFWRTSGEVNDWSVAINESRGPLFEEFSFGMVSFIVSFVSGELTSEIIPVDELDMTPTIQKLKPV